MIIKEVLQEFICETSFFDIFYGEMMSHKFITNIHSFDIIL